MQGTISFCALQVTSICAGNFMWQPPQTPWLHAHHHIVALALQQPFVTVARHLIHRRGQFRRGRFAIPPVPSSNFLRAGPVVRPGPPPVFSLRSPPGWRGSLPFAPPRACSINSISLVLDFDDVRLAMVDFVRQRAIFLVLARLQLLVGVFLDLRLFASTSSSSRLRSDSICFTRFFAASSCVCVAGRLGAQRFAFG